ncbi:hypothetical protein EG68_05364 [Paragonimus skrjabini miyazakii]|uniref:Uncharacterized protein n=1 Tax=Paragonimus skrjabini miyazakii TaxID=59628 RepID=A0A8S9Z2X1_9TREM|nr:hypothetical protein EG68_05364 [Paragonimus skrjabini miyazakii]
MTELSARTLGVSSLLRHFTKVTYFIGLYCHELSDTVLRGTRLISPSNKVRLTSIQSGLFTLHVLSKLAKWALVYYNAEPLVSMPKKKSETSLNCWTTDNDTEDSSESDCPPRQDADDFQAIFELEENSTVSVAGSSSDPNTNTSRKRLPLGRLRRFAPSQITGQQKLEFPGMFVQGFRDGHVEFNIPGVLQDSLKPTDSIDVKINLFTTNHLTEPTISSTQDDSKQAQVHRFGTFDGPNQSSGFTPNPGPSGRFGLSWLRSGETANSGIHLPGPPEESTTQLCSGANMSQASVATQSDSQFGFSTEQPMFASQSLNLESRFISVLRFGQDSTDSGLHLPCDPTLADLSEQRGVQPSHPSGISSRFVQFHSRCLL